MKNETADQIQQDFARLGHTWQPLDKLQILARLDQGRTPDQILLEMDDLINGQGETKVAFRVSPDTAREVLAIFPGLSEGPGLCLSYARIGQHGAASLDLLKEWPKCEERDESAREALEKELTLIGYNLTPYEK